MSNEIATYDERWAQQADKFADNEPDIGGTYMSTKGGVFRLGDDSLGSEICVVVVASVRENTLYPDKYDPDVKNPPLCYAFGFSEADMVPHETMNEYPETFAAQSDSCATCEFNKWGSADKGRGKACQNKRRLTLIPAGFYHPPRTRGAAPELEVYTDEAHFMNADAVTLKLPVTSVKAWAKYVNRVTDTTRRPPFGVLTRIAIVPDQKDQYHLEFETIDLLPDELIDVMVARHEGAEASIIVPYRPWDDGGEAQVERAGVPNHRSRPTLRR